MGTSRPFWPHTIDDITRALDGIWGLVGATSQDGHLLRLERSLYEPLSYTITEYEGTDESKVLRKQTYTAEEKDEAVKQFAGAIGL